MIWFSALQNSLLFICCLALVYYLPGRLLLACSRNLGLREASFAVSLGLGLVLVNTLSVLLVGVTGILAPVFLQWYFPAGISFLISLCCVLWLWFKGTAHVAWKEFCTRPHGSQVALWLLTVFAAVVYFTNFHFDAVTEDSCILRAGTAININYAQDVHTFEDMSNYMRLGTERLSSEHNHFLFGNQGQRLGPGIVVAPLMSMSGSFGLRLAYALQGLMLPGLGFALGLLVLKRKWAAWAVSVLLTFNTYGLDVHVVDENFISLVFGSLALVLLLQGPRHYWLAGMAFALLLSNRHIAILLLVPVAWYIWTSAKRSPILGSESGLPPQSTSTSDTPLAGLGSFGWGLIVCILPELILHFILLRYDGSLFEGALGRPQAPHSLLGLLNFDLPVLLNWPFVAEPMRSYYMAYPTIVAFPLDLFRHMGLVLVALVFPGTWYLLRQRVTRPAAVLLLCWFWLLFAVVCVQSNWVEVNKMGVPASGLAGFVVPLVAGLVFLFDRSLSRVQRIGVGLTGLILPLVAVPVLKTTDAPVDTRITEYPVSYLAEIMPEGTAFYLSENDAYVNWDRDRFGLNLLPDMEVQPVSVLAAHCPFGQFVRHLANPWISGHKLPAATLEQAVVAGPLQFIGPLSLWRNILNQAKSPFPLEPAQPATGEMVLMDLDLKEPPVFAGEPLSATPATSSLVVDLGESPIWVVSNLVVDWSAEPVELIAFIAPSGLVHLAISTLGVPLDRRGLDHWPVKAVVADGSRLQAITIRLPVGHPIKLRDLRWPSVRHYSRSGVINEDSITLGDVQVTSN